MGTYLSLTADRMKAIDILRSSGGGYVIELEEAEFVARTFDTPIEELFPLIVPKFVGVSADRLTTLLVKKFDPEFTPEPIDATGSKRIARHYAAEYCGRLQELIGWPADWSVAERRGPSKVAEGGGYYVGSGEVLGYVVRHWTRGEDGTFVSDDADHFNSKDKAYEALDSSTPTT